MTIAPGRPHHDQPARPVAEWAATRMLARTLPAAMPEESVPLATADAFAVVPPGWQPGDPVNLFTLL